MAVHGEQYRLHNFVKGELPAALYSELRFECGDPCQALDRAISVMELVVRAMQGHWPDDNYWRDALPAWLMGTFREYSPEEVRRIPSDRSSWADLAWSLRSWLDRMRDRDWEWWSSECNAQTGQLTICVAVDGYPFSAAVLEHLMAAAGCRLL